MTSVTQFAQHLMKLDPHRTPTRQCLYNYLKHILDPIEPFTPSVIEDFYQRCLHLDYWRQNARELGEHVRKDLASYFHQQPEAKDLDWDQIRHADEIQVLSIHKESDFLQILEASENKRLQKGDRLKLMPTGNHSILSMVLSEVGTLEVRVYPFMAFISGAQLSPLGPTSHLFYNSKLELMPHVRQTLEGSLLTVICFSLEEDGIHGVISRGHAFQKFESFIKSKTSDHFDLFSQLKKLERFFIDPQSDPYYREIISALEQSCLRIKAPTPLSLQMGEKNLRKGQSALKNAFPGDRLLKLLVTHLDLGLQQAKYGKTDSKTPPTEQIPR
ncbi:hypothetical protein GW916_02440 [bacterium]|nr:hypothetical protein [bacterium]